MRHYWLKFGCFLTGYNYGILNDCSEVAKKTVKRYTAALIIMCLLWGLIGYSFSNRYLHASMTTSLSMAFLFILVIVQIERQIIMQTHKNNYLQLFRGIIAVMMALIGSLIIDQIIFKDDIDLAKEAFINKKVEEIYPARAQQWNNQLDDLATQIAKKDSQRLHLTNDIKNNPMINTSTVQVVYIPVTNTTYDTAGRPINRTSIQQRPSTISSQIPNPNIALLAPLDSQLKSLQRLHITYGDSLANLRTSIERLLKEKTGFLDELNIMVSLLSRSTPALVVYIVWFLLLLGLELFILMSKRHEEVTDYDAMIKHQMDIHLKKLAVLSGQPEYSKKFS